MKIKMELVNVKDIKPDPDQPRKKFDKDAIDNLARTIHGHKIINPIEIDDNNMIITGEMRWRALMKTGKEKTLVKRVLDIDKDTRFERQLIENLHHSNLTIEEEANAIQKLWNIEKYGTSKNFAKRIGRSEAFVSRLIRLPKAKENIGSTYAKNLKVTEILDINELMKNNVDKQKLAKKAIEEDLSRKEIREVAKTIKTVPKDVKEEILKPNSEITLEEAKEIAEFPKPEQRKIVIDQIKKSKQIVKKIIQEEKEVALKKSPAPKIIIDIDQKKVDKMNDIFFGITQEYTVRDVSDYNGITQEKCIKIMRKAYQFIFEEVEKYGKRFIMG